MEPRATRHPKQKKQFNPYVTIGALAVFVIAAFAWLLSDLSQSGGGKQAEQPPPPAISSPDKPAVPPPAGSGESASQTGEGEAGAAAGQGTADAEVKPAADTPQPQPQLPAKDSRVKLTFVGDVMMASKVDTILKSKGYDYPYGDVKPYLTGADITVANLETPITVRGAEQKKDYVYRSSPMALPAFVDAGFDLVNLANNHILDYGTEGLLDTLEQLDQSGVARVGAGKNIQEAYKPSIIEKNGIKIAFLGFSRVAEDQSWYATDKQPGIAQTYTTKLAVEAIKQAKEQADMVVVIAHWGKEREDKPVKEQTDLAHLYIDNGADLVVASHPHVLQGFETYKGKWIAYSLGNFIFTTNENKLTWNSLIMNANCSKAGECELDLVPILTQYARPVPMSDEQGAKLFSYLSDISFRAQVGADGKLIENPSQTGPKTTTQVSTKPAATDNKPAQTTVKQPAAETKPSSSGAKTPAADSKTSGTDGKQAPSGAKSSMSGSKTGATESKQQSSAESKTTQSGAKAGQ